MILSILTPSVPSRFGQLEKLHTEIQRQIGNLPVEHLIFCDNKRRTVGEKRDALLRMAHGDYVAFVDDDDDVSSDYVSSLLAAASEGPDVITFLQHATVNQECGLIEFKLGNPNEEFHGEPHWDAKQFPITKRNAWHVCAWRRELAILSHFPSVSFGEDWSFASKLCGLSGLKSVHIPKVLHFYRHSDATTEAPAPGGLQS